MSDPLALQPAAQASATQMRLMQNYSSVGTPIMQAGLGYGQGRLSQITAGGGLPAYQQAGYAAARAGTMDAAIQQAGQRARQGARSPAEVRAYSSPLVGAAGDVARERAGIGISQAGARINEQQGLMHVLSGGAASSTNLSTGFGRLGNQAISGLIGAGDPTYAAITGGLAGVLGAYGNSQINSRANWLNQAQNSAQGYGNPMAGGASTAANGFEGT